jgi:WD40 repeat protein
VGIAASQTNICGICGLGVVVLNRDFSVQRTYYNGHSHPVLSVAVTDDGLYVATGGCDAAVVVWSVEYGPLSVLSAHNDWVRYLRFTRGPVGKLLLVSAGDDGLMVLWDPLTGLALALVEAFAGHAIRAMDVTQRMIVASGDYQPLSGAAAAPAALHGADDAHRIVSPGTFSVFELDAQRMTICESSGGPLVAHETCPTVCAISPGEEFLVSAAEDERLCVSSIARRVVLWTCAAFASKRRCMSFMNVGTSIKVLACPPVSSVIVVVACGSDGDVVQWIVDPRSGSSQLVRKMLSIGPLIDMAIVTV